ncbi:GDSL family lipase [Polaribacter reichenbachii]|uniref:GDSL family lipase n=1 Tax=Polaribacter reichenbachii TaxID=996801 RepID=A0A1B8U072_9FLAO|nr:GDSL-type esterase/lipase family protein [Polaribacter reichenbachii]APZ47065.1 GDSL family lipase [Polaribacter reichenbachii]AUC17706.1 GDSL family lipase [Polaribacter reichenbachii]OBY65271.1 GDSL family lipase [Polaribacter reichenbachii]
MFWYHDDVVRLENEIEGLEYKPKMVFYGSSTFTLWNDLTTVFKDYNPINLGFGGSTLAACTWYFDRVFKNIEDIDSIVIYAGDNDLGDGRHPEEVYLYLENLIAKIRAKYGNIECAVISIKPSIARFHLLSSIRYTNTIVKNLTTKDDNLHFIDIYNKFLDQNGNPDTIFFEADGLHFNALGYELIVNTLKTNSEIFPQKILEEI